MTEAVFQPVADPILQVEGGLLADQIAVITP